MLQGHVRCGIELAAGAARRPTLRRRLRTGRGHVSVRARLTHSVGRHRHVQLKHALPSHLILIAATPLTAQKYAPSVSLKVPGRHGAQSPLPSTSTDRATRMSRGGLSNSDSDSTPRRDSPHRSRRACWARLAHQRRGVATRAVHAGEQAVVGVVRSSRRPLARCTRRTHRRPHAEGV
jgi:hypothetical protein